MNPSLVSVIIPTYNRVRFLRRAVESVLSQDYPGKEVVVVDDASTDETEKEIAPWARAQGVVWVRHESNRGESAARNTGIRASRGDYLVFLDSDDYFLPGRLSSHVAMLDGRPDLVWVYSDHWMYKDGQLQPPTFSVRSYRPEGNVFEPQLLETNGFQLPIMTMTLRRSVVEEVGGFDESIFCAQDLDFRLRIARRYPIAYIPNADCVWVEHDARSKHTRHNRMESWLRVVDRHIAFLDVSGDNREEVRRKVKALRRRVLDIPHEEAHMHLVAGRMEEARGRLRQAMRIRPFRLKNYAYFLFTFLPPSVYAAARRLKRALRP
ncbi:MAG: glycosyltransferase [Acidobacteriota bacterium]|nr:MAG: glycosyltransferase [Acidobacteriota bacterium]